MAEGDDLGVGGGVVVAQDAVLPAGDDLAVEGEDGSDGDFAVTLGGAGFGDGGVEEVEVGVIVHAGSCWVRQWSAPRPQTRSTEWMPTI